MNWFLNALPLAALCAIAGGGTYASLYVLIKKATPPVKSIALTAALFGYAYFVAYLTLLGRLYFFAYSPLELNPVASYIRAANAPPHLARIEIRNAIFNILMLMPLGIMLPLLSHRFRRLYATAAAGLIVSVAIETAQLATARGVFATEDILHNTLGAALGYALYKIFTKFLAKIHKTP